MSIYDQLDLNPVINADATLTKLGGSLMPPEVLTAMNQAAEQFVDMFELQRAVGERIATLTNNEAAYVCSGAAAGLYLSALACGLKDDPLGIQTLHGSDRNEVIVQRAHRNAYWPSVELAGARLVEIGDASLTTEDDLRAVISERTVAIFHFAGAHFASGSLPLEKVVEVASDQKVPVVVDGAAQLPPPENLWRFTRGLGADLAVFSGGKGLRGPQSSGLIVGRADLIEACRVHGAPNPHRGRGMKVGKEEMVGLLAAIERYLRLDQDALASQYEAMVRIILDAVSEYPGVVASHDWPSEAGQPIPRAKVSLDAGAQRLQAALWEGQPRIAVAVDGNEAILINPETLSPGQELIVAERLTQELERLR